MKKLTKVLVIPILVLTLVGCGKVPVLKNGQEVVAQAKEESISAEDLYQKLKTSYSKYIIMDMIDKIILEDKYKESQEEKEYIQGYLDDLKKTAEQYGYTQEYILQYSYGINTIEEFKESLSLNYKREKAVNDYLKDKLSDKEINQYYKDSIYGDISAKHILISPETLDGMTAEEKEAKKEEALKLAKEIIKKLNNGEDFDKLAKTYSDDTASASKGGDLGWFNTGEMYEEFEKAAFALQKGKYSTTPVETTVGYHIIYKTDEKAKPKLDEVKDSIMDKLVQQKLADDKTLFYSTLEKIRNNSDLDIVDSELSKIYKDQLASIIENAKATAE